MRDDERKKFDERRRADEMKRQQNRRSGAAGSPGNYGRKQAQTLETYNNSSATKKARKAGRHIGSAILTLFLVMLILGIGAFFVSLRLFEKQTGQSVFSCIKEGNEIAASSSEQDFTWGSTTMIYDDSGNVLAELSDSVKHNYTVIENISPYVADAFVAVEDRSFYTNKGIDLKGMVRVFYDFLRSGGKSANGASTITQQLVKLTYLSAEKTLSRKVKEITISLNITKKYTKDEIMEYYCNACCFANGIFGIEDAAQSYLHTSAKDLTLSQAAFLCAIPNLPETYNPRKYPENTYKRRDKILGDMLEEGMITQQQYDEAVAEVIQVYDASSSASAEEDEDNFHNYETTYAVYCAVRYFMQNSDDFEFRYSFDSMEDYEAYRESYSEAYAQARYALYNGGYKIFTTLNLETQEKMQAVVDQNLAGYTRRMDDGIYQVQGAMTVIDNLTGKVVSIIGGRSQDEIKDIYSLNRGFQGFFQPGSSIKPLVVYAPALDSGKYTPSSMLQNIDVESAKYASVSEIQNMYGYEVPLRTAVENSLNGCAYWLFSKVGIGTGLSYLQNMNFSRITPNDYNIGISLGGFTYGVSTEEMANAYCTLANDGVFMDTDCLTSILDMSGNERYQEPERKQVYSKDAADTMTDIMKGVLTQGTASGASWYGYTQTEAAGKTGTTNDNKDAWFCGFTPYYSIAVWVGCDTPTAVEGLQGSSYPLAIWRDAMLNMIKDKPYASLDTGVIDDFDYSWTADECNCGFLCDETYTDQDCPICKRDYTKCEGKEASCICDEQCYGDTLNEDCPICRRNMNACTGATPVCICGERCITYFNENCAACSRDISLCTGEMPSYDDPDDDEYWTDQGVIEINPDGSTGDGGETYEGVPDVEVTPYAEPGY